MKVMNSNEFNRVLTKHDKSLRSFAYSLTTNMEDAKDLVQETYRKALTNREKFINYPQNLKSWLMTIMRNTFINDYHRKIRHNKLLDYSSEKFLINNSERVIHENPEMKFRAKEIEDKLKELDKKHRVPLEMYLTGYKYVEIAEKLQITLGTVKSRIFFSRQKIKEEMEFYN